MLKKIKVSFVANETNFAKPTYDPSYTIVQIRERQPGFDLRIHGIWIRRLTTIAISLLVREQVEKDLFISKDIFAMISHTKTTHDVSNHTILIVSHLQAPPTMTSQASQARSQSNTTGLDHPIQPYRVGLNVPWEL